MGKLSVTLLFAIFVCLFSACEKSTPEQIFTRSVINANLTSGFAGSGMRDRLENPSVKLTASGQTETMTRKEIVESLIRSTDEAFQKVKKLGESDDNREMLQASIALYDYVSPVYRKEYTQLAGLYDNGASKAELETAFKTIEANYFRGFQAKEFALNAAGKPYAKRHGIKVKWDIETSPSP